MNIFIELTEKIQKFDGNTSVNTETSRSSTTTTFTSTTRESLPPETNVSSKRQSSKISENVSSIINKITASATSTISSNINISNKKITVISLLVLLTPSLLYYIVDRKYNIIGFLISLYFTIRYIIRLHLGNSLNNSNTESDIIFSNEVLLNSSNNKDNNSVIKLSDSRMIVRFPVDLGKLLHYLDLKREETGIDISPTHITLKAISMAYNDLPKLNGHLLFNNNFYLSKSNNIDLSVSIDIIDKYTLLLKINDTELKSLEYIAYELSTRAKELRTIASNASKTAKENLTNSANNSNKTVIQKIREFLPIIKLKLQQFGQFVGSNFGISLPKLGIVAYPYGICSVMTSPNRDGSDADLDIALLSSSSSISTTTAPIIVTIGGIRVLSSFDSERKLIATPVLNYAIAIDTRIGSLTECRKFCSKLQLYLNNPSLLDGKGMMTSELSKLKKKVIKFILQKEIEVQYKYNTIKLNDIM